MPLDMYLPSCSSLHLAVPTEQLRAAEACALAFDHHATATSVKCTFHYIALQSYYEYCVA